MPIKIIACEVMKEELLSVVSNNEIDFQFITMGLHLYPKKLGKELQNIISQSKDYSRIILAFGLCGGAVSNLQAINCNLTIPKVHDCISIFIPAQKDSKEIGNFYLSCGWINTKRSIISEHNRVKEKYGERKALKILEKLYSSYKKVIFIKTGSTFEEASIIKSKEIAELLNLKHEIVNGNNKFIEKIVNGPWNEDYFINIAPFESIKEEDFGICVSM